MLPGIKIIDLKANIDERGSFTEMMRADWNELLGDDQIAQANLSRSYPNVVRAWHRHERGQVDYYVVVDGAMKICAFDERTAELAEIVVSSEDLKIVRMPGHYWHGTKCISPNGSVMMYFVTRLYDPKNPDELRRPWNDAAIVPAAINGNSRDPRCSKPWDWLWVPSK